MKSRSVRIPIDVFDAIDAEAVRRDLSVVDELRRVYVATPPVVFTGPQEALDAVEFVPVAEQASKDFGDRALANVPGLREKLAAPFTPNYCQCAKPALSAASGMTVCSTCHKPRRR